MAYRTFALVLGLAVGWVGCGDDSSAGGAGGAGGSPSAGGGGAGGSSAGPSAKPVCSGEPSGSEVPLARADTAAAFAPDGLSVVMFGGDTATVVCGDLPARQHVDDTWILEPACGGWTEVPAGASQPEARARHAMASDASRNRALLFGGRTRAGTSGPYTLFADVWAFDFQARTWSALPTNGPAPSPRHNATVAVVGDTLYVFGGSTSTSGTAFTPENDLFALDLTSNTWSEIGTGATKPPARLFHAMASDASKLYVVSGGDANAFVGPFLEDAWAYDIASDTWSDIGASFSGIDDPGRIKPGLLALPTEQGTALHFFGGHDAGQVGNRNDVSVLDAGSAAWRSAVPGDTFNKAPTGQCNFAADFTLIDEASPERRSGFAFAVRPDGQSAVIFGGDTDCGRASDAWWYDAVNATWEIVRATPVGLSCLRYSDTCSGLCG